VDDVSLFLLNEFAKRVQGSVEGSGPGCPSGGEPASALKGRAARVTDHSNYVRSRRAPKPSVGRLKCNFNL